LYLREFEEKEALRMEEKKKRKEKKNNRIAI